MMKVLQQNVLFTQRFRILMRDGLHLIALLSILLLNACNPSFEQEAADLENGSQKVNGEFRLSLFSATTPAQPQFTVRGDLKQGQRVRLFTGSNCQKLRDEKTVSSTASVKLYSSPLINNGYYTYKIRVVSRDGHQSPCLGTNVKYSFTNGFQLSAPTLALTESNYNRQPLITVTGAQAGNPVSFYTDSSCSDFIGSQVAGSNGQASRRPQDPLADGSYKFYAKTVINGETVECSDGSATYTIDSRVKSPLLVAPLTEVDNKNIINVKLSNLIQNAKLYVYLDSSDCNSSPIIETAAISDPSSFILSISQRADLSYYIDAERTYRFNFAQEIYPGSGASNVTPCSSQQLVYTYDITPESLAIETGKPTSTNKLFSPSFQFENFNKTSNIKVYRNNNCSGAPLATYTYPTAANGSIVIPADTTNNTLIGQADGTYLYTMRQNIAGLDSNCSNVVNYTIDTTPTLTLSSLSTTPSSDPFPKFVAQNIATDQDIEVFASNNCGGSAISDSDYSLSTSGSDVIISFTSPRTVTSNGENFSIRQTISEASNPDRTSPCSNSVNYHVNSSSFNASFGAGQAAVGFGATPSFTFSNTLDNSVIHIFQEATVSNCQTVGSTPDETISTGTNDSVNYTVTTALTSDGIHKYFIREFLELGANDYYSSCHEIKYRMDTYPKNFKVLTSTPNHVLVPKFQASNINDPSNYELIRSLDDDCTTAGDNTVMPIDLASDTHSSDGTWLFNSSSELAAEGAYHFFIRNTDFTFPAGCSNSDNYELDVTPTLSLGLNTTSGTNDFLPNLNFTDLKDGFYLRYYFDDDCNSNEFASSPEDFTSTIPTSFNPEVDLRSLVTADGTYQISAKYTLGAFSSKCVAINYAIDGTIEHIANPTPGLTGTSYDFNPNYTFSGLIPDTQVQLYSSQADCNGGTNILTELPAATNSDGDSFSFSFDVSTDVPSILPGPITDMTLEIWARQYRSSNGYVSTCKQAPSYILYGPAGNLTKDLTNTLITAPYFAINSTYNGATDVEVRLYTDDTCSTAIPGDGTDVNAPGIDNEEYAFLVDYNDASLPFNRSGTYQIYSRIYRDDPTDTNYGGTYLSSCTAGTIYEFDAVPNNIRFTTESIKIGTDTFASKTIPVINTPTPTFLVDNIIDHAGTVVAMHIDRRDGGSATNNQCDPAYAATVADADYTGNGYRVDAGVIPGNGVYTVYFKQKVGQYNDNGPSFDCSQGFTFKVDGIPENIAFATTSFTTDLAASERLYIDDNIYNVQSTTDDFTLTLSSAAASTVQQTRMTKLYSAPSAISGTVSYNSGSSSTQVNGSGTSFTSQLNVGDLIIISGSEHYIESITSNTQLSVNSSTPVSGTVSGSSASKRSHQGSTISGTVAFNSGSSTTQVNGTSTTFLSQVGAGDIIRINNQFYRVDSITDDTTLVVSTSTPLSGSPSGRKATIYRAVVPGFATITSGSTTLTGSNTLSPDNDITPGVVINGIADDLHVKIYGISDANYGGTPQSICNDGDAIEVSAYIDSDVVDNSQANVMIDGTKRTTIPIDISNLLLITDDKFHFAARIVGETTTDVPDPAAFDDCTPEKLDYILEGTPSSISIVGESDLTINNHKPTFNFSNLVKGRNITLDHSVRAYHGAGDQATAKTDCEADTSHYAENSGGGLVTDTLNGAAEFTQDGTYFVYFRQFHNKGAGGADNYSSDCIYDELTPGDGIFSFNLDGELTNPTLISPATQPSDQLTLTIQVENYRKSAGRSIQIFNDTSQTITCDGTAIETIPDGSITEVSPGLFQFTTSRLTDLIDISDVDDLALNFNQIEDGYESDCSSSFISYNLDSTIEMHFENDPTSEDKTHTSSDPTPGIVLDMDTIIDDAQNTIEFHLTSNCSGAAFDSVTNPHASGRINGSGVMNLAGISADGAYNIYIRQVLAETKTYTGICHGPHRFTLEYDEEGAFVTEAASSFELNPRFNVVTAEDGLDINVYLNLDGVGANCDPANLVSVKNNVSAGTTLVDDIYLIQDALPHLFYFQLDDDADYTSNCIQAANARYELDGRPINITIGAGATGRNPTPTVSVGGIYSLSGTNTIVQLFSNDSCVTQIGSRTASISDISGGVLTVTSDTLAGDGQFDIYAKQIHDAGSNGYDAGVDYASDCSAVSFTYTLDGKPKNVLSTGPSSPSNSPNPSFQLKNIFNGHEVQAFASKTSCEAGVSAITLTSSTHDGNETSNITLGLEDDGTYNLSFRQRKSDGSYVSNCTDEFAYTLDRRPSGITFNSATNILEPSFDVAGTVADFNVFIYTSLENGGDGCDVLRGSTGGSNGTTTVTASSAPISLDGDYKFYARMIKTAGVGDTKTGTVSFNSGTSTTQVNGTGTLFETEISSGDLVNINGSFYRIANVVTDTILNVEASTPLAGTVSGEQIAVHNDDETACSSTSADYSVDLKPNNITFDSNNPGKLIRPEISMNNLIQGATVHLYYINKPADIFASFNDPSGCPAVQAPANPDDPAVYSLGSLIDSNDDGDIEASTPITTDLPADADSIYPIYAYQSDGVYNSRCNFLGNYTLDLKPQFGDPWVVQQNEKNDVIDINLENLVTNSTVEIFVNGCDETDRIATFSNITGLTGDSKSFNLDLEDRLEGNLVDNTTYRFFASQTLPGGFQSGCSTLSSASYHFNSSPIVTEVDASGAARPEKAPQIKVTELLQGSPRSFKVYAIPEGSDPCSVSAQLIYDGAVTFDTLDPRVTDAGNGLMDVTLELSTEGGATPFVNDGTYTFRAEQTLDSGNQSGCYVTEESAEYTLNSKPTLASMVPAGGFGSTDTPSFTLTTNEFVANDNYTINVYVNDTDCSGTPEVTDWEADPDFPAVDISALAAGFTSNYVFFNFKFVDASAEHTGTSCSDSVIYDYNALELNLLTASPDPNDDLSPLIEVDHVNPSDTIRLYADSSCSNQIAEFNVSAGTAADSAVFIETNPLNSDGTFNIHATREPNGGNTTLCSKDFVTYQIDVDPTSFVFAGGGSVGVDDTPTFNIDGLLDDAQINLYRDANCTQLAAIGTTGFGVNSISLTSSQLSSDGLYEFHITQSKSSNGFTSKCSSAHAKYTLLSKPSKVSLLQNNPSSDNRPFLRVEGVAENATVRLFKDDGNGGSACDTEIGDAVVSTGTVADIQISTGILTSDMSIDIYARHEVGAVVGSCSDSFVTYNYLSTAKDWSLHHAQRVDAYATKFGSSVAIDKNIAVIGEPEYSGSGNKQGRVRILENDGNGVWTEQTFFQASTTEDGDQFGYAVDVYFESGTTYYIVASAPYHDTTAGNDNRGHVYVFSYNTATDTLDQLVTLTPFDPEDDDAIGHSVAIHSNTLAYSTITKDGNKGKVYYYRSNTGQFDYALETGLLPDDAASKHGHSLSLDDNYLIAGSSNAGKVYVYDLNNSMAKVVLTPASVTSADQFGYSLDHNASKIIVGMPGLASGQGKIWLYNLLDLEEDPIQMTEGAPANNNRFGHHVAISSNSTLAVSAPGANSKAGKAYVYEGASYDVITDLTAFDVTSNIDYGHSLDFGNNGSNGQDLIISAPSINSLITKPGVYIHTTP